MSIEIPVNIKNMSRAEWDRFVADSDAALEKMADKAEQVAIRSQRSAKRYADAAVSGKTGPSELFRLERESELAARAAARASTEYTNLAGSIDRAIQRNHPDALNIISRGLWKVRTAASGAAGGIREAGLQLTAFNLVPRGTEMMTRRLTGGLAALGALAVPIAATGAAVLSFRAALIQAAKDGDAGSQKLLERFEMLGPTVTVAWQSILQDFGQTESFQDVVKWLDTIAEKLMGSQKQMSMWRKTQGGIAAGLAYLMGGDEAAQSAVEDANRRWQAAEKEALAIAERNRMQKINKAVEEDANKERHRATTERLQDLSAEIILEERRKAIEEHRRKINSAPAGEKRDKAIADAEGDIAAHTAALQHARQQEKQFKREQEQEAVASDVRQIKHREAIETRFRSVEIDLLRRYHDEQRRQIDESAQGMDDLVKRRRARATEDRESITELKTLNNEALAARLAAIDEEYSRKNRAARTEAEHWKAEVQAQEQREAARHDHEMRNIDLEAEARRMAFDEQRKAQDEVRQFAQQQMQVLKAQIQQLVQQREQLFQKEGPGKNLVDQIRQQVDPEAVRKQAALNRAQEEMGLKGDAAERAARAMLRRRVGFDDAAQKRAFNEQFMRKAGDLRRQGVIGLADEEALGNMSEKNLEEAREQQHAAEMQRRLRGGRNANKALRAREEQAKRGAKQRDFERRGELGGGLDRIDNMPALVAEAGEKMADQFQKQAGVDQQMAQWFRQATTLFAQTAAREERLEKTMELFVQQLGAIGQAMQAGERGAAGRNIGGR
jgi:hypothetical protein